MEEDRKKAHRERKKRGETIPVCDCGRQLKGEQSRARGICTRCWKKSAAYKAETLTRVRQHRLKLKQQVDSCSTL